MQTNFLGRDREKQLRHVICRAVLLRLVLCPLRAAADKRKSDGPCRWVIAFLVPCGTGRVNDKKVNEENSKVIAVCVFNAQATSANCISQICRFDRHYFENCDKNKSMCGAEFAAPKWGCIQVSLVLDTTYHFGTEIARAFLKFPPKNKRKIAFL